MSQATIETFETPQKIGGSTGKKSLPLVGDIDIDAEVARFEVEERARLGIVEQQQWVETMANAQFTAQERPGITLLLAGLTVAHDYLVGGALTGLGYNVQPLDCPTNDALRFGKEFGNRGQCNPTYFTVGNLVMFLSYLRDQKGMTAEHIVKHYVFVTAGACGPCRFGMYVTEYRKALRDAGFDGFRVVLFQQSGGFSQATGEDVGLRMDTAFFTSLTKAILVGDVINAIGYRLRPFEVEPGATDRAMETAKKMCHEAFINKKSVLWALYQAKSAFSAVKIDRLMPKPKVSIIGEFWAMTTEGDGNYQLQRFLEGEGAECDIQLVAAWLLYMIWESKNDTNNRKTLRGVDFAKYGLGELGTWGVAKRELTLKVADWATRVVFQTFAHAGGLYGYHLPDMHKIADVAHGHYNNDLRGGEGHMEVGKLIQNVVMSKAHMTLSVKPFGCMPSAGVSDGVQSLITEKFPGTIFCAVETSGDGRVNFYSRVQMYLFKARAAASAELERVCQEQGVTLEQVRAFLDANPRYSSPLHKAPHSAAGSAADLVAEVAPIIKFSPWERARVVAKNRVDAGVRSLRRSPEAVAQKATSAFAAARQVAGWVKEDIRTYRETRASA
ncbi:MAG TPA: 2-hydroxyglutaryl-CoA dehydratase [Polyangiaceae bacterium]|jgi:predicted nucleotide-binding protein (sugar kinase/HSP70/actin superfamily)